jgi:phosphatidylserine/phosphatidylglycerophosphate/cardiolipin synthase-like enzyme
MDERPEADKPTSLLGQLRDAARELLAERRDQGRDLIEGDEGAAVEQTTGLVAAAWQRMRAASGFTRFLRPAGRDQVVGVGEPYELAVSVDPVRGVVARIVRFWADERAIGEAPVGEGSLAWLDPRAREPGLLRIEHEVLGPGGVVLRGRDPQRSVRVQVAGEAPAVAVDAGALLEYAPEEAAGLRRLVEAGFLLFYLDLAAESRMALIREALAARELPDGAVLSHPLSEAEFRTLGVDFRGVFATTALRRVRARGVALVALVSADPKAWKVAEREGIDTLDVWELRALPEAGLERLRQRARELHASWQAADPLDHRLDAMTSARAVDGHACRIELDNARAREVVLSAIEGAQREVHLSFYILEEGQFTEHLCVRLIAAARRGVRVRLLVDALYSREGIFGLRNPIVEGLRREPGIEVLASDPIPDAASFELLTLKRRDHRKLLIVDGARAIVSGRNAGDAYYTGFDEVPITDFTPHERIPWLDAHLELRGPLVAAVEEAFLTAWRRSGGEGELESAACAPAGTSRARLLLDDGAGDAEAMGAYEAILDASRAHVYLVNDYPIVSSLAAAVRRAVGRGVKVTFLTGNAVARRADGSFFRGPLHREMFEYMTKRRLETLMRIGVVVVEYATPPSPLCVAREGFVRPYVHAKIATADGLVASVGSANLDVTASYWEREANVIVQDPEVVEPLERALAEMVARGHVIDGEGPTWRAESTMRELASWLWPDTLYA